MKVSTGAITGISKVALITVVVFVSNQQLNFWLRIEELRHNFDGYVGIIIFIALWALCLAAIYMTAFLTSTYARVALAALIAISTLVGFSYELVASEPITYNSFTILWDAKSFANEAWIFYRGQIGFALVMALIVFCAIVISPRWNSNTERGDYADRSSRALHWARTAGSPFIVVAPLIVIFAISVTRGGAGTGGLPIQYKMPAIFAQIMINSALSRQFVRDSVSITHTRQENRPHIVLIMDESVRGDYLDINRNRGLTPALNAESQRIVNFGYATAASNCSTATNLALRMGATAGRFLEDLRRNPYIWNYARQAGYRTVLVQAQVSQGVYSNNLLPEERDAIDEIIYADGDTLREKDINAAVVLGDRLRNSTPNFIYVNKAGTHFPYESAYDVDEAVYTPHLGDRTQGSVFEDSARFADKELMINSYKNAIQLSVDRFFQTLFETADFDNAVIIYTSDHGQNLLDSDIEITHCANINASPYEALVPLMVFTNSPGWRAKFETGATRNFNRAGHFNIVATILQLFGYSESEVLIKHGHSLFEDVDNQDRFVSGIAYFDYRLSFGEQSAPNWNYGIRELIDSGKLSPGVVESP